MLDEALALAAPFFRPLERLGALSPSDESDLPDDARTLLAHRGHMTVTLEAWHESLVDVRVVAEERRPESYARHSLLARRSDDRVVQSGVMRIALSGLPDAVRSAIESGAAPLGRVLIRSNLLREVEPLALWRIEPGATLAEELADAPEGRPSPVWGRSARILVDGRPAVDLLEIVRP